MSNQKLRKNKGIIITAIAFLAIFLLFRVRDFMEISENIFGVLFLFFAFVMLIGMIIHAKGMFVQNKKPPKNKQPWE